MVDAAVIFGANRTRAEKEMNETLEFEQRLASVSQECSHFFRLFIRSISFRFAWPKKNDET